METVNLLLNDEVTSSEERIRYEIDEPDFPYEITWTSSDEEVVTIEERDGEYFIVTQDLGQAVVYGEVYHADDLEAALEMVEIQVLVSEEPSEVEEDQKNFGFSYAELLAYGNVEIYLNELVGVYRAVTPSTGEDLIYLADRSNNQVVVIDSETFEIEKFVVTPDNVTFANKAFSPSEIVTDRAGRIYVIANNVFEGIMQFSREGEFNRYTGVNYVQLTPWQVFWRNIATESQLRKQQSIINTSFTGMTVDNEGFIYATSYALTDDNNLITDDNNMIKKINPTGNDILRRNGYHSPKGDLEYWQGENLAFYNGPSQFSSIAVNEYGLYSVIDNKMGRIFTYDNEGNLLYISGNARYQDGSNANTQTTVLRNPAAIAYLGEQLVVLDRNSRSVIIYEPTDIAKLINKAAELEYYGDRLGAAEYWTQVIQQNANYEYAYIGIGRMHLEEQNYVEAMEYFQFGEDRDLYSRAYKLERDKNIRKYFSPVVGSLIVLTVGLSVYKKVKNRHKPKEQDTGMGDE